MSKKSEIYNVENCFMFEEEDMPPKPPGNKTKSSFCHSKIMEFRPDKPYRLSLYVQPHIRKLNLTNSVQISNNSLTKRNKNQENVGKLNIKNKTRNQKLTVSLFEEANETSNNFESTRSKLSKKNSKIAERTCKSFIKSVLSEVDVNDSVQKTITNKTAKSVSKTKQKKIRRSYEKKFKTYEPENVFEPSSDQILKEIDIKKIKKSQIKKPQKEDKEFEKWAENMNSAFDDIDKFELSISYD